jgi:hypothetical protein
VDCVANANGEPVNVRGQVLYRERIRGGSDDDFYFVVWDFLPANNFDCTSFGVVFTFKD